jgi:hypothetical protein
VLPSKKTRHRTVLSPKKRKGMHISVSAVLLRKPPQHPQPHRHHTLPLWRPDSSLLPASRGKSHACAPTHSCIKE